MPTLTPKAGVRYTQADLDAVGALLPMLSFIGQYDAGAPDVAIACAQLGRLGGYITEKRKPKPEKKPAKPAKPAEEAK